MAYADLTLDRLPGPDRVESYRVERYIGEDQAVRLEQFTEGDRERLTTLYAKLRRTLNLAQSGLEEGRPDVALRMIEDLDWRTFLLQFTRDFGLKSLADVPEQHAREILHDIRGSALSVVAIRIDLALMKGSDADRDDLTGIFTSARDHLKILRNVVADIDPERRRRDTERKDHAATLLREKWLDYHTETVRLDYFADFDGTLSSCCLEFSSLDRVLYNLVNNAIRHTADGRVGFFLTRVADPDGPGSAKFVLANAVKEDEARTLRDNFGDKLGGLFAGGFTIGGSGVGLRVVADLVKNAYGLSSLEEVVGGGYVGAEIRETVFCAWAHWPVKA